MATVLSSLAAPPSGSPAAEDVQVDSRALDSKERTMVYGTHQAVPPRLAESCGLLWQAAVRALAASALPVAAEPVLSCLLWWRRWSRSSDGDLGARSRSHGTSAPSSDPGSLIRSCTTLSRSADGAGTGRRAGGFRACAGASPHGRRAARPRVDPLGLPHSRSVVGRNRRVHGIDDVAVGPTAHVSRVRR